MNSPLESSRGGDIIEDVEQQPLFPQSSPATTAKVPEPQSTYTNGIKAYLIITIVVFVIYLTRYWKTWSFLKHLPAAYSLASLVDYIRLLYVMTAFYGINYHPHSACNILVSFVMLLSFFLSDSIDGDVARAQNATTEYGEWLDHSVMDQLHHWVFYLAAWSYYPKQTIWFQLITLYRITPITVLDVCDNSIARGMPAIVSVVLIIFKIFVVRFDGILAKMEYSVVIIALFVMLLFDSPICTLFQNS